MEIIFKGNITSQNKINHFNNKDLDLIGTENIINNFNPNIDYIEYIIYNAANDLLNINFNYNSFKLPSQGFNLNNNSTYNTLEIDPIKDLQQYYDIGEFKTQYNFFKPWISNYNNLDLFIKDISSDRTELKISSINIINLKEQLDLLLTDKNSVSYLKTYLLNFGNNNLQLLTNIQWDGENIIVKLYNELPNNISINDSLFIVEELTNVTFQLNLSNEFIPDPLPNLKGPNFEISINNKVTSPTKYESSNSLLSNYSGSSIQTILNKINLAEIEINIDYTDFENFIRFSSAETRLNNFYNKVKQIEDYNNFITNYSGSSQSNIILQINQYSSNINDIITKFDGYENYLYFNSGSTTWPKNNTNIPYILESTGSSNVINWFQSTINESINFDINNPNQLINAIPEYITVDNNNIPYINFINMIGHYFDNIWIYIKSITDYYKSNNNLNEGISKDLVFFALQDLGVKLYNTKEDDDLYNYILGNNNSSSQQLIAELYKRIYHNIPLLFKGKGSSKNIQELITMFGITGSILKIKEYGGNSNTKASLLDYNEDKVRIVNNTIYSASYGSILHPNLKLSDYVYENYKNDDSRIDVAFSPQNQLDIAISSSIINSYLNFNIDDYIGDPRYELSGSYSDLNNIRYNAISSSFTASYDIRGFIELIQYFDNTLFKMIDDYIPAKSNLSKGIVIKQQALERIKWKRQLPIIENQTVYDLNYSTASLSNDYDKFYNLLQDDKKPYYNGELLGSDKNIYNEYFIPNNLNPYIISSSFNSTLFNKSDYNVLLNNVDNNMLSLVRKKIEIQPYSSQSILVESEIQDSNYYDTGLNKSRYDGTKLISAKYNDYIDGDIAFGKTSVIDIIKNNVAYFDNINPSTLLLSNISELNLKYLINDKNNVLDLNDQNNNINDIQNIFKSGEKITISYLTNNSGSIKSNNLDVEIFKGGYTLNTPLYSLDGLSYKHYELPNALDSDVNVNYNLSTLNHYVTQSGILSYHVYRNGIFYSVEPKKLKTQEQPYVISSQLYLSLVYPSPVTASYYTKLLYDNNIVANVFLSASEISVAPVFNIRYFNYNGYIPTTDNTTTLFDSSSFSFEGQSPTNKFKHGGRIYVSSGYGGGNEIYYPNASYNNYFLNSGSFPIKVANKTIQLPQIISDSYSYIRYNNQSTNEHLFGKDNYNYLNIKIGDKFAFYPIDFNPTVGTYWKNKTFIFTEYDITKVYNSGSDNKLYIDVNQNLPEFKTKIGNDSNLEYIPFYIIRSIDPNETSILLKSTNFNEFNRQGIVYPQYVNKTLKTKSGDIIKNLKSQNLI